MNNDLISRSALKEAIKDNGYSHYFEIFDIIDNAPTVEITEKQAILHLINSGWLVNHDKELREKWKRPQGEWIEDNEDLRCPFCKVLRDSIHGSFCPNCGAKLSKDSASNSGTNYYGVSTALLSQPSVERPRGEWIPVSERLPDDLEPVNITWINHEPEPYYKEIKDKPFTATGVYFNGQWYWWSTLCTDILAEYSFNYDDMIDKAIEITHWKALPEPHESEDK